MTKKEAIGYLCDGHSIWKVTFAEKICKALKVPFNKRLIQTWKSDNSGDPKGLTMNPGNENSKGVYSLHLSGDIASYLKVIDKARSCIGRGFQAQAYAEEIGKKLGVK
jgi:hypothetical protein